MADRGKFITLEGGEGAGKSTQAKRLAAYLRGGGQDVVLTREVGGSPSAEEIRNLWLSKIEGHWDGLTEVLLISAARREHLVKTIWPALERGVWVISDRFVDSTRAYQGIGQGLGLEVVDAFYKQLAGDFEPDMTFLLDIPVQAGQARLASRGGPDDRYEQKDKSFHESLRDAYLALAIKYAKRIKIIDANRDADSIATDIETIVHRHLG
jgi:dTMP kinase